MTKIPSRDARPGDTVRNKNGDVVTILERKADNSGWWLKDSQGGLSDRAIDVVGDWEIIRP